ncbi:polysaccharide deacetylase family protein [Candidatus Saccharibacteria bacterium]|nr:polysaccharide deacetylase family protein [Candidatus Saccharibacteria bacterium]
MPRSILDKIQSKFTIFFTVIALIASLSLSGFIKAQAIATNAVVPKISFTFDDGYSSVLSQAAPTLASYGYTGTSFVITGCVGMTTAPNTCAADTDKTYMTWDQILSVKNSYGWEIGSHTIDHSELVSPDENTGIVLTDAERINELVQSKADLAAHGIDATSFADPYGDWNMQSLAEIAKYYAVHRPFADTVDYANNNHNNAYPYSDLLPYVVQVTGGVSVDQIKLQIDRAKANNYLLVLVFHDILNGNASSNPDYYEYNTSDLAQIAAYAQQQGLVNTNMTEAFINGTNLVNNGSFENGQTGWTTDAPSNVVLDTGNNGSYPSPTNSIMLTSNPNQDSHLFFDLIPISSVNSYVVKSYLNVLSVDGTSQVGFYIDEYDINGNYLSTQAKPSEGSVWVEMLNFNYVPSSSNVAQVRIQVVVTAGTGLSAFLDNVQLIQVAGSGVVVVVLGDIDGSGKVDALDLSIVLSNWGKTGMTLADGDLDASGTVDALDLSLVLTNWSN